MLLNRIIVHEISKNINETGAVCDLSNELLPVDEDSINLITILDERYLATSVTYGIFKNEDSEFFPANFNQLSKNQTDANFISFSIDAIGVLTNQIKNIPFAKGGYFAFADYNKNGIDYFSIFLIRNTKGILFRKNQTIDSFRINPTTHIDLDKLAMACRISKTRYSVLVGKYLSFIKHKLPDISEYFINWIAATEIESSSIYTDELFRLTGNVSRPNNEDGSMMSLDAFREKVYDYIHSRPDGIIDLHQMGEHFYNDSQYLINFAVENEYILDSEFKADKRKTKKFIRINVSADGSQLKFTRGEFNKQVRLDSNNSDIVIIESEKFANKLRDELYNNE
jgi:nucleoid-associated protein